MKQKHSFVFYKSFFEAIENIPKKDQLDIYRAIPNYIFNRVEPQLKGMQKTIWILIKPQVDANLEKYQNGKKGGRPKKNLDEELSDFDLENL